MAQPIRRSGLQTLVGRRAFSVEETEYFWEDVILAAGASGDWAALENEVREGVACIRHMRATGDVPSETEEEAAAVEFRTARQLITAAETETWLRARGLSVDNWLRYVRRSLLRRRWLTTLPDLVKRYPASDRQVGRALRIVGICSGHLNRFAQKLAGRAAVHARTMSEGFAAAGTATSPPGLHGGPNAVRGLLGLSAETSRAKLEMLATLERSFQQFAHEVLTDQAVQRQIAARHTDWLRIDYCSVAFATQEMAREAALCVRQDGEPLETVAARGRSKVLRERSYLAHLDPGLRGLFLSAKEGELVGPVESGGEFRILMVLDKVLPTEADPDIRRRAEQEILDSLTSREVASRVRWHSSE